MDACAAGMDPTNNSTLTSLFSALTKVTVSRGETCVMGEMIVWMVPMSRIARSTPAVSDSGGVTTAPVSQHRWCVMSRASPIALMGPMKHVSFQWLWDGKSFSRCLGGCFFLCGASKTLFFRGEGGRCISAHLNLGSFTNLEHAMYLSKTLVFVEVSHFSAQIVRTTSRVPEESGDVLM